MRESFPGYTNRFCNNRNRNGEDFKIKFKKKINYVDSRALFFLAKPICDAFKAYRCSRFLLSFQVILHCCFKSTPIVKCPRVTVPDVNCVSICRAYKNDASNLKKQRKPLQHLKGVKSLWYM